MGSDVVALLVYQNLLTSHLIPGTPWISDNETNEARKTDSARAVRSTILLYGVSIGHRNMKNLWWITIAN